ncbi:MAG: sugar ABC transporter substrate-binding protein [Tagaea sp.]|nr:sugar ABC transporter substrate-binding protein [Tagaea sp.]
MSMRRRTILAMTAGLGGMLAAPAVVRGQAGTTIELWTFLDPNGRGVRAELLKEILTQFERDNTGVSVRANIIQWTEISPQLLRAARAGNVPDVVMLYSPFMAQHVQAGSLLPIDDYMRGWSQARRDDTVVLPMAKDRQGRTYALPWELRVFGLLYRLDLLRQANLEPPRTLDDMARVAGALQRPGMQGLGFSFHTATSTGPIEFVMPQMIAQGARVLADDGSAAFGGAGTERVLQYMHDLVHRHRVLSLDTALMPSDDVQNLAIGGQMAMLSNGSHRLSTVQERSQPGAQWSFMPFPSPDAARPVPASLQGWTLAIPRRARNPQVSWKLIEHWTSAAVQKAQAVRAGYLPTVRSVAADRDFATGLNAQFRLPEIVEYVARNPLNFVWPENSDALNEGIGRMVQQVIGNRSPIREAIAAGERAYNDLRR